MPRLVVVDKGQRESRSHPIAIAAQRLPSVRRCPREVTVIDERHVLRGDIREGASKIQVERRHLLRLQLPEFEQTGCDTEERPAPLYDGREIPMGQGDQQVLVRHVPPFDLAVALDSDLGDARRGFLHGDLLESRLISNRPFGPIPRHALVSVPTERVLEFLPKLLVHGLVENPAGLIPTEEPSEPTIRPRGRVVTRNRECLHQGFLMQERGAIGHVPERSHEPVDTYAVQELLAVEIFSVRHELEERVVPDHQVIRWNDAAVETFGELRAQPIEP